MSLSSVAQVRGPLPVDQMNVGGARLTSFYMTSCVFILMCIRTKKLTSILNPILHGRKCLELVKMMIFNIFQVRWLKEKY